MRFIKNRFVIGCICIIVACLVGFVGVPLLSNVSTQKVKIVVAAKNISKGSEITEDMFYEHNISKGDITYSEGEYFTSILQTKKITSETKNDSKDDNKKEKQNGNDKPLFKSSGGKLYASCDIHKDDIVTVDRISSEYPYADMTLRTLDRNYYAVSASVSSLSAGVAGKIREGDVLTLMICTDDKVFVDSYLNFMKVISVSNSEANDIKDNSDGSKIPSVVTFEATLEQAILLAEYNGSSTIHYALAARGETDKADELLEIQGRLLSEPHGYSETEG